MSRPHQVDQTPHELLRGLQFSRIDLYFSGVGNSGKRKVSASFTFEPCGSRLELLLPNAEINSRSHDSAELPVAAFPPEALAWGRPGSGDVVFCFGSPNKLSPNVVGIPVGPLLGLYVFHGSSC